MPNMPVIVEARDPRRIKRNPRLATRIIDRGEQPDVTEEEAERRGEAADRLWQELKQAVNKAK